MSFQEELALPFLREAVTALEARGFREYDRADGTFSPPADVLEKSAPTADILGITPLVAILIFIGGTFSQWAASRVYDASWEAVRELYRSLLHRRREDPATLDQPLTLRFEFWLEAERAVVGARMEIASGDDGLALVDQIPRALAELAAGSESAQGTARVVVVRSGDDSGGTP